MYHSNLQEAIRMLTFENGYFTVRGDGLTYAENGHFCHLVYQIQFCVAPLQ